MGSFLSGALGTNNGFQATGAKLQGQDFTGELQNAQNQWLAIAFQGENSVSELASEIRANGFWSQPKPLKHSR